MKTFTDLGLSSPIQRALKSQNYSTPTPIQAQTLPHAMQGRDVLGCAQTGTGKTAAFALPILHQLGQQNRKAIPHQPFALILTPTRELAGQVHDNLKAFGQHLKLFSAVIYGGVGQGNQVKALKRGVHIVIATPGRLLDLMNQGHLKLNQLS
ncbi:MAG: DEAD/DEAH box helicase, partial [Planctomycetaceae bacterium]|nr:DEAD/DEAH box helicase [Planctomycetaceae bacterium]